MSEPIVQTLGLTKVYGTVRAVDALELEVPRGAIFGLLGQNGAGKSTTIRMLLGLVRPTAGEVRLFGRPLSRERMQLLGQVGCLVEGPAFYPYLSGAQNLKSLGDVGGGTSWERVNACLDRVGLAQRGQHLYRGYSTGMRQRLGVAGALLHDPELVILDEPLNGLDPPAVLLVRRLIYELRDEGKTVVISSHILHEVQLACDQLGIIDHGRVVAQGMTKDLLRSDAVLVEVTTPHPERALEVAEAQEFVDSASVAAGGVVVRLSEDAPARLNKALVEANVEVAGLVTRARTLEDLFHELSSGSEI